MYIRYGLAPVICAVSLFLAAPVGAQEATLENEVEINIFEQIKIELLDLQKMGDELRERLVGETIRMTLTECVRMALESNEEILVVSYEPLLSGSDIMAARGEFDPVLSGSINHNDSSTPASPIQTAFGGFTGNIEQKFTDYRLALNGKLHWGTQYSLEYAGDRDKGTFTGGFIVYGGGITATITQPVMRGWGTNANKVRIRTARNSLGIAERQIESTVLDTVGEVIKAYWDLVGTIDTMRVRQESLSNALRLVEINEQRLRIGTAAAIEVLQAKAGAATRQGDVISARTAILNAEDVLKNLMGMYDGELFSSKSIAPVERPGATDFDWDLERSITAALENRPELHSAELQIENAQLEAKRARNELMPQLDTSVSYNQNARQLDKSDAFQGVFDKDGRVWTVGVTGSIPIGNHAARATYKRSKLFVLQQEQRLRQVRQQVMLNVRMALRSALESQALVESNRQARILQEANVAAEEKRLRLGVTTSQNVLDIQEDLTGAQTEEVRAMVNFEKALVDLQVSEGRLLENLGIEYEYEDPAGDLGFFKSVTHLR